MEHPPEYEYRVTTDLGSVAVEAEAAALTAADLRRRGREFVVIERRLATPWHRVSEPDDAPLKDARLAVFDVIVTPPDAYSTQGPIGIDIAYRGIAGVTEVPHRGSAVRVQVDLDRPIDDPF